MARLVLSPLARTDLLELWAYIGADSPDAADRVVGDIESKLRMLAERPAAGRARPELRRDARSFPSGQYVILYRVLGDAVEILRVVSGRRDLPSLI